MRMCDVNVTLKVDFYSIKNKARKKKKYSIKVAVKWFEISDWPKIKY